MVDPLGPAPGRQPGHEPHEPHGPGHEPHEVVRQLPGVGASAVEVDAVTAPTGSGVAAFFDLDNTVIKGASLFHLAKELYRRGFFPTRVILRALWLQVWFRVVGRENAGHIENARSSLLSFIAGHTVAELEEIGEEVYQQSIAPIVWPGTRTLAQAHLDAGEQVWLVTAAPVEMAGIIAYRLGMNGALGTTAEHGDDGVYTGRLRGELLHGAAKAAAVVALAQSEGLDLTRCAAYSDSANDLPMLSLVGRPGVINPDRRLRHHAEQHGWRVRDFRRGRRAARVGLLGAGGATGAYAASRALVRLRRR